MGSTFQATMKRTEFRRFMEKVSIAGDECWPWEGSMRANGYGRFGEPTKLAHRMSYEYFRGEIPDDLQLDHLCRNRGCINPWHLEPVTPRENLLRGQTKAAENAAKTHCPQGHPYDERSVRKNGSRRCLECHRQHERRVR